MSSFCPNFFNNVMNDSFGVYKTCCLHIPKSDNGEIQGTPVEQSIESFWNNPEMMEARVKSIKGEPIKGCESCYKAEENGGTSLRKDLLVDYENDVEFAKKVRRAKESNGFMDTFPTSVEFRVGNLCNLKCRMCQPQDSNLINNEYKELKNEHNLEELETLLPTIDIPVNVDMTGYIKSIKENVHSIDIIRFSGGEPLINKSFHEIIDYFIDTKSCKEIDLRINTNLTKLTEAVLHKLLEFKQVTIDFSIDGIEEGYEYIRYPMKWDIINRKIELLENFLNSNDTKIKVNTNFTVQTYNILHMVKFLDFFIPKGFTPILHPVHNPKHLSIQNVPENLKEEIVNTIDKKVEELKLIKDSEVSIEWIISKLIALKNLTKAPSDKQEIRNFTLFTKALDDKRNQKFSTTFPEISKHFTLI